MNTKKYNYRRIGAYILVVASAVSMLCQYALQGILASGRPTSELPDWFWPADWAFWAVRAIIEAVVILYLFETNTENARDRRLLNTFEIVLICLITLTISPAIRAQALGQTMPESVSPTIFTLWVFGLGMYSPLMIGGIATALRVQPGGVESISADVHNVTLTKLDIAREQITKLNKQAAESAATHDETVARNQELAAFKAAVTDPEAWKTATSAARLVITQIFPNGNRPETKVLAELLKVSGAQIGNVARDVKAKQKVA